MIGIVPAAKVGSRSQPLPFSTELLPVGSRGGDGEERPKAVSEYLVERMVAGGATRICFVLARGKSDIVEYYGASAGDAAACYVVQPEPTGLCDAVFRALPLVTPDEHVLVGLPDAVWFPRHGFSLLPSGGLSFLLFPVSCPEQFDAVVTDGDRVREIQVKQREPATHWIWGAFKLRGSVLAELYALWLRRERRDDSIGTLVNAYIEAGAHVRALAAGLSYVDVGTLGGYREAIRLLTQDRAARAP